MRKSKAKLLEKYDKNLDWMQARLRQIQCKEIPKNTVERVDLSEDFEELIRYARNCLITIHIMDEIEIIERRL